MYSSDGNKKQSTVEFVFNQETTNIVLQML